MERRGTFVAVLLGLALVSFWASGASFSQAFSDSSLASLQELGRGLASPDLSPGTLSRLGTLAVESLAIGLAGTGIALFFAVCLAVGAAEFPHLPDRVVASDVLGVARKLLRQLCVFAMAFFRAVPEIVWAYLFVRIVGLGPAAAVFAIALTFSGIIGKLFAELIEAASPHPVRRLEAAGVGRVGVFLYGVWPQVRKSWLSYALFRSECAIRSAAILGIVGAGGLGQEIELSLRYYQFDKLSSALLFVLALVFALELVSFALRRVSAKRSATVLALALAASLAYLGLPWSEIASSSALNQFVRFASAFTRPSHSSDFLLDTATALLQTLSMAFVATALAAGAALALAPLASFQFSVWGYARDGFSRRGIGTLCKLSIFGLARFVLQVSRSIPELVWALLLVVWMGPGVSAGIFALWIHTVGILGRLYSEIFADAEPKPVAQLELRGARTSARYLFALLPQCWRALSSFTLFRFEVNVRAATMMGFVGAGGLGDRMHTAISLFHMRDLAGLIACTLLIVWSLDALGTHLRRRLSDRAAQ